MGAVVEWIRSTIDSYLSGSSATVFLEAVAVLLVIPLAWFFPRLGTKRFASLEQWFRVFAASRRRALRVAFATPIVLRLMMLSIYPPPQPTIHDEFSHLLIADTLKEGRLANPTHPMLRHLETIHVIFSPTYASKYPIGQGVALALPQFIGLPAYTGVWLSCGLMSAAIYWMLIGWLPSSWAFFGTVVIYLRVTTLSSWMHSYWGGAVAGIGGALAVGAYARLRQKQNTRHALLFGAGIAILATSRPYEGFVLAAVLGTAMVLERLLSRQVVLILAVVSVAIAGLIAVHNYSVTGKVSQLPYQRNRELYGTPQTFYWQAPAPAIPTRIREFQENYLWQFSMHEQAQSPGTLWTASRLKFREFWLFFLGPIWTLPLLLIPWFCRDRALRLPLLGLLAVFTAVACYPFFYPHYLGPVAGVILLLLLYGLRRLRLIAPGGRPFGVTLSRLLVVLALLSTVGQIGIDAYRYSSERQVKTPRTQVLEALDRMGGTHVVFVRYIPGHDFHKEVVYNAAEIDASAVIWARDLGPFDNRELMDYYRGRKFWVFEPDYRPPRLMPYEQAYPMIPGLR